MAESAAPIRIGERLVGPGEPVYVIAEVSANHRGSRDEAERIVRAAAAAGADAVKLQTYTPDTLTLDSDAEPFRVRGGTLWDGRTLHELYREGSMPWEWHPHLAAVAREVGVHLFSTAFDPTALAFLEKQDPPVHKIASFELVDLPLIRLLAATGRPLILSTGMATLAEIEEAVAAARGAGATALALLHTNSGYPADPDEMHLATIPHLAAAFGVPIGLSDHTLGTATAVAAVALGATLIEKHVTLSRADGGLDAPFSLEPAELEALVRDVRVAERAVGRVTYGPTAREEASLRLRRSLFVVEDVRAGQPFTAANVRSVRPADGLHPRHLDEVLARVAAVDVARGTPLAWEHVR